MQRIASYAPGALLKTFSLLPPFAREVIAQKFISHALKAPLEKGDLNFLTDRWFSLCASDIPVELGFSLQDQRIVCSTGETFAVQFTADAYSLAELAAKLKDPDTLFFQRKLLITGDTELALNIKNLLDDIEITDLPFWLCQPLTFFAQLTEKRL